MPLTSKGSDQLFELPIGTGGEPFEERDLRQWSDFQSRAARAGADFKVMAMSRLNDAGARIDRLSFEIDGFPVDAAVHGVNGRHFLVLVRGTPDEQVRGALRRTDTVEKVGFMAMQLHRHQSDPILLITSDLPERSTKAGHYLASLSNDVWDVVSYRGDLRGFQRLQAHFQGQVHHEAPAAPWRMPENDPLPALFDQCPE